MVNRRIVVAHFVSEWAVVNEENCKRRAVSTRQPQIEEYLNDMDEGSTP